MVCEAQHNDYQNTDNFQGRLGLPPIDSAGVVHVLTTRRA
jgi:hypothetical protein